MKLRAVHLEGFRGATKRISVTFDPSKSVTVLFGENGAGKSTVIDAIDFACNESFGSLEGKSLGDEKKHNHVGSLTNSLKTIPSVDVEADTGVVSARLVKGKIVVTEKPIGTGRPQVSVLRRSQILQLIEATPAKRFEALRAFFSTPAWTLSEAALRQAHKTRQDQFNTQTTRLDQANSTLQTLWVQNGSQDGSSANWAANVLIQPNVEATERLAGIKGLEQAFSQYSRACAHYRDASEETHAAEVAVEVAREAARQVEVASAGSSLDLVQLLEQAKHYVEGHQTDGVCPVCTQEKEAGELRRELAERIASFSDLSKASAAIEGGQTAVRNKSAVLVSSKEALLSAVTALTESASSVSVDEGWLATVESLSAQIVAATISPEEQSTQIALLSTGLQPLRDETASLEKRVSLRDSVQLQVDSINAARDRAKDLEAVTRRLGLWLVDIEGSRKDVLDGELTAMSSEVSALYARIHPDEGASLFNFAMKASAVSSLDFEADFLGYKNKPVQAYFSESHLDTLGVCVFLVVARRKSGKDAVVVLDDVLTSVDATHLDRVMSVIDDVAQTVSQVIVATHYRLWRDKYRWGKAPLSQTEVIEFGPWSLNSGIQLQAFQDALSELTGLLKAAPLDRQVVASKGGIVLESMLDFLTLKFACALPRNARAEYTLGALADGIDKKLAAVLRAEFQDAKNGSTRSYELRPLIGAATTAQWVRNAVGCHFNSLDSQIPDSEVLQFVNAVLELAKAMICDDCRTMTTKDKTGSNWQCRCGALKLWPLARPKD